MAFPTAYPSKVVTQVSVADIFADTETVSSYVYHDGVWDGGEREFRGFARVDRFDASSRRGGTQRPQTATRRTSACLQRSAVSEIP